MQTGDLKVITLKSIFLIKLKFHGILLSFIITKVLRFSTSWLSLFPHHFLLCNTFSVCNRFRLQSAMMVHARCHLPEEVKKCHQCDQCPKRFGTKPNLVAHKRIHAGVREYTCHHCGKGFVQKGNLDNHLVTHTVARPYVCSTCGKTFKTHVRLKKHGTVHSGDYWLALLYTISVLIWF